MYMECPLEIALKRNSLRNLPVSSSTLETMFNKMELPEPEKFPWEQYYVAVKAEEEISIKTMYVKLYINNGSELKLWVFFRTSKVTVTQFHICKSLY